MNPTREANRKGYIVTKTGVKFYPFNPSADAVNAEDIAHSLAMKCRWNGHCDYFYSVAQHSIDVMLEVAETGGSVMEQFQGLMHDASEAYMVDMPTPLKIGFPDFIEAENVVSAAIAERYGYPAEMSVIVKAADKAALLREGFNLFDKPADWLYELPAEQVAMAEDFKFAMPMCSFKAKQEFLRHHRRLWDAVIEKKLVRQ